MSAQPEPGGCQWCGPFLLNLLREKDPTPLGLSGAPSKAVVVHNEDDPEADAAVYIGDGKSVVRARMNPAPFVMVHNGSREPFTLVLKPWGDWADDEDGDA